MAIVVLVLWLFTAGAGFSVLISSNLKGDRPVGPPELTPAIARTAAPSAQTAPGPQAAHPASATEPAAGSVSRPAAVSVSRRAAKRARRAQFDPPSLVAARNAPVLPGARSLLEFAHPACGIIGLAFWLGFSLVHNRILGWIGFGLAAATACAGLTWFAINIRAARRHAQQAPPQQAPPQDSLPQDSLPQDSLPRDAPPQDSLPQQASAQDSLPGDALRQGAASPDAPPSFRGRLVALHGAAAALTVVLAALTGLILHG